MILDNNFVNQKESSWRKIKHLKINRSKLNYKTFYQDGNYTIYIWN